MRRFLSFVSAGVLLLALSACASGGSNQDSSVRAAEPPFAIIEIQPPSAQPSEASALSPAMTSVELPAIIEIEPSDDELVCITDYIPTIYIDLRYATPYNFTGQAIYDFSDAWLRYGTVKKLMAVQSTLMLKGYSLKIWDAYRPGSAQFKLWDVVSDATYVANPYMGHSSHSNGGTLDLTLVYLDGSAPEMPTDFDDFSLFADRDYSDVSETAGQNAQLLEQAMESAGFLGYTGEWWHFSDCEPYPYEDLEKLSFSLNRQSLFQPDCEEYISLRAAPDYEAEVLSHIPRETVFQILGWNGDFARIEYQGQQGYVSTDYIRLK